MSVAADVLCAGIVVADHVCTPVSHVPAPGELVTAERILLAIGGCAANTAVDLARLGVRAAVAGCVGGDAFGRIVTEMLREQGVDVASVRTSPAFDTSQTLIVNVVGQDRRFIHTFGANADFAAADVPADRLGACKAFYLGGYLAMPRLSPHALAGLFQAARRGGARTVLDVVVPGPGSYLSQLEPLLPHVDVFLPNADEARLLTGESDPVRQAEAFRGLGAGTVVVTRGAEGCVLVNRRVRLRAGVYPVANVDGSGGGDAFAAGYLFGLLHGMEPADCLRVASALGASCVRAIGTTAGVFTRAECEEFLRRHTLPLERV
jgi:sugar/nucleoside kinase (ribokinase family)